VIRQGSAANAAGLAGILSQFRTDLGGANNGVGGSFAAGRREINWDGVPDSDSAPNFLTPDFFNTTSPRGVVFQSVLEDAGSAFNDFMVSANAASGTPVRFRRPQRLLCLHLHRELGAALVHDSRRARSVGQVLSAGTTTPAGVSGFGVVMADVDSAAGGSRSILYAYAADGRQLSVASAPAFAGGLSFVGISFNQGELISHVIIKSGTHALSASNSDGVGGVDAVAMDDFIYGEPKPLSGCVFEDGFECSAL
jgi:hypothetical protein